MQKCLRYSEICPNFCQDMFEICQRFSWYMADIFLISAWGMHEICQIYAWDSPSVCILAYLTNCILAYLHICILAYLHTCIPWCTPDTIYKIEQVVFILKLFFFFFTSTSCRGARAPKKTVYLQTLSKLRLTPLPPTLFLTNLFLTQRWSCWPPSLP